MDYLCKLAVQFEYCFCKEVFCVILDILQRFEQKMLKIIDFFLQGELLLILNSLWKEKAIGSQNFEL